MAQSTIGTIRGRVMGIRTDGSSYSIPACVVMGSRPEGPLYPSGVSAVAAVESIVLRWTAPTKNADGTTLNAGAINGYWVYEAEGYSPAKGTKGVDYDDRYWVEALIFQWPANNYIEHSFCVTTVNNSGQESDISSVESATATTSSSPTEDDGLWAHRMGYGAVWTENTPASGVTWSGVNLYWKDNVYAIANDNTTDKYIWWDHSDTLVFKTSDTLPSLTFEDVLIAYNSSGTVHLVIYSPMIIADYLRAGVLQSSNWAGATGSEVDLDLGTIKLGGSSSPKFSVTAAGVLTCTDAIVTGNLTTGAGSTIGGTYIDSLGVGKLVSGTIASQSIVLGITGTDDCEIRAGIAAGDFVNAGGAQGFIIGLDYSDSSKAKLYFGGPDGSGLNRFMKWTGSVLDVNADIVCTDDFLFAGLVSSHISYAVASAGSALDDMTTNSGDNYTGSVTRSYRVQIDLAAATDTFKWSHDGGSTWEVEDVAITGAAQTLEDSITVTFAATTGHALNNYWDFTAGDTTTNIHNMAGVYQIFASTVMGATDTRIKLDGYGLGGGIDLYSGPAAGSHVDLHAEGSISLDASGGA